VGTGSGIRDPRGAVRAGEAEDKHRGPWESDFHSRGPPRTRIRGGAPGRTSCPRRIRTPQPGTGGGVGQDLRTVRGSCPQPSPLPDRRRGAGTGVLRGSRRHGGRTPEKERARR